MKATLLAGLLGGWLLLVGAPAWFEVRGAEVQVHRAGDSAEVRIVYDLTVREAACGWFQAEFDDLPGGAQEPKAVLLLDGKEFPARVEEAGGKRRVQAFQESREEGRKALEGAKSVQLALAYPKVACTGPEVTVALPVPRTLFSREEAEGGPKKEFPRLSVRFDAEVEGASAEVRATFRSVPFGARLVLRSDSGSAGASVHK